MLIDKLNQVVTVVRDVDRTGKMTQLILKIRAGIDNNGAVIGDGSFDKSSVNDVVGRMVKRGDRMK